MIDRRTTLVALAGGTVAAMLPMPGQAHHGWSWTDDGEFQLEGILREVRLGNPHGELTVDADGEMWLAEIGQPWRNHEAGLTDAMLVPGIDLTLLGHRSADPGERRMKAERVVIAGQTFDLYPDRS